MELQLLLARAVAAYAAAAVAAYEDDDVEVARRAMMREEAEAQAKAEAERQAVEWDSCILAFLSHAKQNAHEASSHMRTVMLSMLEERGLPVSEDAPHVFRDTDNLRSINRTTLEQHVEKSKNFIFLLSKGIFGRPWCMFELNVAVKSNCNIIPVLLRLANDQQFAMADICKYTENYASSPDVIANPKCYETLREWCIQDEVQSSIVKLFENPIAELNLGRKAKLYKVEMEDIIERMDLSAVPQHLRTK